MDQGLRIIVSADVQQVATAMQQTEQTVQDLEKELNLLGRAIDASISKGQDISKLEDAYQKLSDKIKAAKAAAAAPIPPPPPLPPLQPPDDKPILDSISKQRLAFLDLGRIVTGQGFSLRSLASNFALLGPGVTIAAAAIYGLYEVLNKQTDAEKKAEEEAKRLHETLINLKSAADVTGSATGSEEGNIARVQALAAAVRDSNLTYTERKRALEELKETNKSYFGDLTLEASSLSTLSDRVNKYSQALITEAIVKGQVEEIAKISTELEKQARALNILKDARDRAQHAFDQAPATANVSLSVGGGQASISEQDKLSLNLAKANDEYQKQRDVVLQLRTAIATYTGELNKNLLVQLDEKPLKEEKAAKDELKSVIPILQEVKKIYDDLAKPSKERLFKLSEASGANLPDGQFSREVQIIQAQIAEAVKKVADTKSGPLQDAYKALKTALNAKLEDTLNPDLHSHIQPIADIDDKAVKKFAEDSGKLLTERTSHLPPIKSDIKVNIVFTDFELYQQDFQKNLDKLQSNLYKSTLDFTKNIQDQFAITLGKGFGLAFQKNGIREAFDSFMQYLGSSIEKLGEELIVASGVFSAIDVSLNSLLSNPALAAAAGVAAVAAGELIKSSFKAKPFATGGVVTGPTLGLVGEAGPEVIFPLDRLNQFVKNTAGNGQQNINVTGVIRGRDLAIIQARDSKLQNMTS